MKASFLLILACCLPVPAAFADDVPAAEAAPAARPDVSYDFFNFDAMRKSVPAGRALYEFIFFDPDDPRIAEETLVGRLNADYGLSLPDSLDNISVTRFFREGVPAANLAIAKFNASKEKTPARRFLDEARRRDATRRSSAPDAASGSFGADFPEDLAPMLPPGFGRNAQRIFTDATDDELSVSAQFAVADSVFNAAATANKRLPLRRKALEPGVLVFRSFVRRESERTRGDDFLPSVPAGEFLLVEKDGAVKISLVFYCADAAEKDGVRYFFSRFKMMMKAAARGGNASLAPLAESISVGPTAGGDGVRIEFACPAEDFPALLKWYRVLFSRPPSEDDDSTQGRLRPFLFSEEAPNRFRWAMRHFSLT